MFNLRTPTRYDFVQALERAARAFVAAAIAIYPAQTLIDQVTTGGTIDTDLAVKAILAGSVAAVAFLWRFFLPDFGRSAPDPVADPAVTAIPLPNDEDPNQDGDDNDAGPDGLPEAA
jgi:hypothetical protein